MDKEIEQFVNVVFTLVLQSINELPETQDELKTMVDLNFNVSKDILKDEVTKSDIQLTVDQEKQLKKIIKEYIIKYYKDILPGLPKI